MTADDAAAVGHADNGDGASPTSTLSTTGSLLAARIRQRDGDGDMDDQSSGAFHDAREDLYGSSDGGSSSSYGDGKRESDTTATSTSSVIIYEGKPGKLDDAQEAQARRSSLIEVHVPQSPARSALLSPVAASFSELQPRDGGHVHDAANWQDNAQGGRIQDPTHAEDDAAASRPDTLPKLAAQTSSMNGNNAANGQQLSAKALGHSSQQQQSRPPTQRRTSGWKRLLRMGSGSGSNRQVDDGSSSSTPVSPSSSRPQSQAGRTDEYSLPGRGTPNALSLPSSSRNRKSPASPAAIAVQMYNIQRDSSNISNGSVQSHHANDTDEWQTQSNNATLEGSVEYFSYGSGAPSPGFTPSPSQSAASSPAPSGPVYGGRLLSKLETPHSPTKSHGSKASRYEGLGVGQSAGPPSSPKGIFTRRRENNNSQHNPSNGTVDQQSPTGTLRLPSSPVKERENKSFTARLLRRVSSMPNTKGAQALRPLSLSTSSTIGNLQIPKSTVPPVPALPSTTAGASHLFASQLPPQPIHSPAPGTVAAVQHAQNKRRIRDAAALAASLAASTNSSLNSSGSQSVAGASGKSDERYSGSTSSMHLLSPEGSPITLQRPHTATSSPAPAPFPSLTPTSSLRGKLIRSASSTGGPYPSSSSMAISQSMPGSLPNEQGLHPNLTLSPRLLVRARGLSQSRPDSDMYLPGGAIDPSKSPAMAMAHGPPSPSTSSIGGHTYHSTRSSQSQVALVASQAMLSANNSLMLSAPPSPGGGTHGLPSSPRSQFRRTYSSNSIKIRNVEVGPSSFQKIKLLGKGDVGKVYLVRERKTERLFAMKVLSKSEMIKRNKIKRALAEQVCRCVLGLVEPADAYIHCRRYWPRPIIHLL